MKPIFPTSQSELLKTARGEKTQRAFAEELGVDRSCWSRYENERLGAPVEVLNHCLRVVGEQHSRGNAESGIDSALRYARGTVVEIERLAKSSAPRRARGRD